MPASQVIVISGTSTGFGFETARLLAADGHRVFGTVRDRSGRNAEPARKLAAFGVTTVELDVTNQASVDRAAAMILDNAGHVDVLINNAGTAHFGVTEAFTPEAFERQYATNVIGPQRLCRAFLPGMREHRSGFVMFVSSAVGRIVIPFGGPYVSSKWALEALAESYSYELRPFGVDVAIVEPGAYKTNIMSAFVDADDLERVQSYGEVAKTVDAIKAGFQSSGGDPQEIAEAMVALVKMPAHTRPLRTSVPAGAAAEAVNVAAAPVQRRLMEEYGLGAFLSGMPVPA